MTFHINNLPSDLLSYLFEFLPFKQLFIIESVCTKWKLCATKTINGKEALSLKIDLNGRKLFEIYAQFPNRITGPVYRFIIDDNNIDILKKILTKCPNIKSIDFQSTLVTGKNNLITIANLCPKLERIDNLNANVNEAEWNEFSLKVGPKLIQCYYVCGVTLHSIININYVKSLFKHFKNIEILEYHPMEDEDEKELFGYLKSCENLNSLRLYRYSDSHELDDNMISVLQRLHHLKININQLLKVNFDLNNLKELSILISDFNVNGEIKKISFDNLTKLTIYNYLSIYLTQFKCVNLSKLEFPKLESLQIHTIDSVMEFPKSFINQIKHIKHLKTGYNNLQPNIISSLTQLESIQLNFNLNEESFLDADIRYYNQEYEKLCSYLYAMIHHQTLKSIKININHRTTNINIFDKLIVLNKSKANIYLKIVIWKSKLLSCPHITQQSIDEYVIKFNQTKQLAKFNMELILYQ